MKLNELLSTNALPVSTIKIYYYQSGGQAFTCWLEFIGNNLAGDPVVLVATRMLNAGNSMSYGILKRTGGSWKEAGLVVFSPVVSVGFSECLRQAAIGDARFFESSFGEVDFVEGHSKAIAQAVKYAAEATADEPR